MKIIIYGDLDDHQYVFEPRRSDYSILKSNLAAYSRPKQMKHENHECGSQSARNDRIKDMYRGLE